MSIHNALRVRTGGAMALCLKKTPAKAGCY